eukprot:1072802-Prorocentrum_lima.AAC.1
MLAPVDQLDDRHTGCDTSKSEADGAHKWAEGRQCNPFSARYSHVYGNTSQLMQRPGRPERA